MVLHEYMIDWSIAHRLIGWSSIDPMIGWSSIDPMIDWSSSDRMIGWSSIDHRLIIVWSLVSIDRLNDRLIDWSNDRSIDRLIDSSIHRLIDSSKMPNYAWFFLAKKDAIQNASNRDLPHGCADRAMGKIYAAGIRSTGCKYILQEITCQCKNNVFHNAIKIYWRNKCKQN